MSKKLIATGSKVVKVPNMPDHVGDIVSYYNFIQLAGGIPVTIPITIDKDDIKTIIDMVDGVVLTGGSDIHPFLYEEDPHPKLGTVDIDRDEREIAILMAALEKEIPVLGICRGMQLINVALGGTLYQDIESQMDNPIGHDLRSTVPDFHHQIDVVKDSYLYEAMGSEKLGVNSIHHQAIKELAPGLKISATSSDGIIEAFEDRDRKIYGTQFHPEEHIDKNPEFLNIIKYALDI